jgi:hypothetical protein
MHDDDMLDDSWFDRPVKGQALTVEMVQAALRTPHADVGPCFEGLEDSWFDKPARDAKR